MSQPDFDAQFANLLMEKRSLLCERLSISMKVALIAEAFRLTGKSVLVLTGEGQEASTFIQNLEFFALNSPIEFPSWETLPQERIAPSPEIVGARARALHAITTAKVPLVVVSSLQASLQKVLSSETLALSSITLRKKEEVSFDVLKEQLGAIGYERKPIVVEKGEFAIRGGIVDIFPVTESRPLRLEFYGDEIESIRYFEPHSQRTQEKIDEALITPAKELEALEKADEKNLATIFSMLGKDTLIVLDDLERLEDRYASLTSQGGVKSKTFMSVDEWLQEILSSQSLSFCYEPIESLSDVSYDRKKRVAYTRGGHETIHFTMFEKEFTVERVNHPFLSLSEFYEEKCLMNVPPEGEALIDAFLQTQNSLAHTIVVQSLVELEWFKKKVEQRGGTLLPQTKVKEGYLSCGFGRIDTGVIFFPTTELTGRVTVRRDTRRVSSPVTEYDAFELTPGDHVVHFHHGLGKYLGVEKKPDNQGKEQEFFLIEYADNSRLYVPLAQAHLVSKYVGGGEESPKLHVLGTNKWKKLREDTERAIVGYASDLLQAQAKRVIAGGYAFPADSLSMQLFEAEFPYTETEDQLKAIREIKEDMCSNKAMDRLVCGDVGYGKTEVAMRAAIKAVLDGKKQVAVLAPTTVLALQHYENFVERMNPFGARIGVLSRFATPKQNKKTIEDVKNGEIDIIIGTHRLIQKDVEFRDLGLLIVDEEQRFGVRAKEKLKLMKEGVDAIALSATPIPRTLYLSLIGLRDLSTISTPPYDRLPIKTVVCEPADSVIQSALLRELNRGGQAFYIHNRVETIFEAGEKVKKLLPRARIAIAHGQMDADELDLVFHAFKRGDVDVLVCTSIVENGIDIPNANTIIIDRADRFGIAELYQLRGRVGRWNKRAYAYFLIPQQRILTEIARKRIEAIAQAGGYGGGMRVAMRDLEIRGAGDILGTEQSGHVAAIGFHLYCKMLKRTIDSLQGKAPSWTIDTRVDTPFDAKLPEYYVNEVSLRMEFYQRLGEARTVEEVAAIAEELHDRFGALPEPALWLLALSRVRAYGASHGFTTIKLDAYTLTLERKTGKESHTNKVLVGRIKTPEEFEEKVKSSIDGMIGKRSPSEQNLSVDTDSPLL